MCFNVKTQESSCIRISHSDYHFGALNGEIIALYATTMSCYGGIYGGIEFLQICLQRQN